MNNVNPFTAEELELSDEIIKFCMRNAANDFGFLKNPIFTLKPFPTDKTESICADYMNLYYNPKWAIEQYRRSKEKVQNAVVHCVLHCLYLHPSAVSGEDMIFSAAADLSILIMMYNAGAVKLQVNYNFIQNVAETCGSTSTNDIFNAAMNDPAFRNKLFSVVNKHKWDDHKLWYEKIEEEASHENGNSGGNGEGTGSETEAIPAEIAETELISASENGKMDESEWSAMLASAKASAQSGSYGSMHGNMFMETKRPDRFSRFSYKEYIRRFAMQEIVAEDPETIDMMLYTAGFDLYDDVTLVEFNELKESSVPSDIIIALDISGSCSGDIASNFLRQVYSLFEEMDIRSNVNIHAVTFDTRIVDAAVIKNRADANALVENYDKHTRGGWGGTDFNCVFEYADGFQKKNNGKKLKGLFFFSDGCGTFPMEKKKYRTTFFIPVENSPFFQDDLSFIPQWVECVKYNDEGK